ncbi:MAG: alpha/beta hydrolase [Planctomycetaceae bacterium]|nr:alpha/beta hydrolase [Planctomycetaceae bacterium]MCA9045900.1 alpha/beta hydrolase [Planctomycetaceae bacterium]MCB9949351.1 alpha/beta hydrolase [Planctomycetaceae bacterium]
MTRRQIPFKGGSIGYLDGGEGDCVLYFHGTGAGKELAAVMESDLIKRGYRLLIPDRPGYVGTSMSCGSTSMNAAAVGAAVLDAAGVQKAVVIGTSGGGLPAIHFAANYSDRTVGLVLQCAQSHRWDTPEWLPSGKGWVLRYAQNPLCKCLIHWAHHLQTRFLRWMKRSFLRGMTGARYEDVRHNPASLELCDVMIEHSIASVAHPHGIENDLDILLNEPLLTSADVRCPTLIIHDNADPVVPFRHAEWSKQLIPHAEVLGLQLGGHLIWIGNEADAMYIARDAFIRQCHSK